MIRMGPIPQNYRHEGAKLRSSGFPGNRGSRIECAFLFLLVGSAQARSSTTVCDVLFALGVLRHYAAFWPALWFDMHSPSRRLVGPRVTTHCFFCSVSLRWHQSTAQCFATAISRPGSLRPSGEAPPIAALSAGQPVSPAKEVLHHLRSASLPQQAGPAASFLSKGGCCPLIPRLLVYLTGSAICPEAERPLPYRALQAVHEPVKVYPFT